MSHFTQNKSKNISPICEPELMEPKAETISKLIAFAASYHVEKSNNNSLFEIFLN